MESFPIRVGRNDNGLGSCKSLCQNGVNCCQKGQVIVRLFPVGAHCFGAESFARVPWEPGPAQL